MKAWMKQKLHQLLVLALLLCVLPLAAQATTTYGPCGDKVQWSYNSDTGKLTISGTGDMYDYTSSLSGANYPWNNGVTTVEVQEGVTSIGELAFYDLGYLETVSLPSTVKSIGSFAFYDCYRLKSIVIPSGVTRIEEGAFSGCRDLTSVTIPATVTFIGDAAFKQTGLTTLKLPGNLTQIGSNAFYGCNLLTELTVPGSVQTIGTSAFGYCGNLEKVTLEEGITAISRAMLKYCHSMTELSLPSTLTSIGYEGLMWCTSLTAVEIPAKVQSIGQWAFCGCDALTSVNIPNAVTHIPEYSFADCIGLQQVSFGTGVTGIGNYAFRDCSQLKAAALPTGITKIGELAFSGCSGLTSVTLPDTITAIGDKAFQNCTSLASVRIPTGLTSFGEHLFYGCTGLTSVTIPSGVTCLGDYTFMDCTSLKSVTIPNTVTNIGSYTFNGCTGLTSVSLPSGITYLNGNFWGCSSLASVSIPGTVTSLGIVTFSGCASLKSISLPSGITTLGQQLFDGCVSLQSITIPGNVTKLDYSTLAGCTALTELTVPAKVTNVAYGVIRGCSNLKTIRFLGDAPTFHASAFFSTSPELTAYYPQDNSTWTESVMKPYGGTVTWKKTTCDMLGKNHTVVTDEAVEATCSSTGLTAGQHCSACDAVLAAQEETPVAKHVFYAGSDYARCKWCGNPGGGCGTAAGWIFDEETKVLTIRGTGAMADYDQTYSEYTPWYGLRSQITAVTVEPGITAIGKFAFADCTNITSVQFPQGVTAIHNHAFYGLNKLTGIAIPADVTEIGRYAFARCTQLADITLPEGLTTLGGYAFTGCTALKAITIPTGVTALAGTFDGCTALTEMTVPGTVKTVGLHTFYGCTNMTSLILEEGIETIGDSAIASCPGLTSLVIPSTVTTIEDWAIGANSKLASIQFKGSAPSLQEMSFSGLKATVYYPAGDSSWTEVAGSNYGGTLTWKFTPCDLLGKEHTQTAAVRENETEATCTKDGSYDEVIYCSVCESELSRVTTPVPAGHTEVVDAAVKATCTESGLTEGIHCSACGEVLKAQEVVPAGHVIEGGVCTGCGVYGTCGEKLTWTLDTATKTLTVTGTGAMSNYGYTSTSPTSYNQPWAAQADYVKNVVIGAGVTTVGNNAFYRCRVSSVSLPDGLTRIGYKAFSESSFASIEIPSTVTEISSGAFEMNSSLKSVELPAGLTKIYPGCFSWCTALQTIVVPEQVTTIDSSAFSYCSSLWNITLPGSLREIKYDAFKECTRLQRVNYGSTERMWNSLTIGTGNECLTNAYITYTNPTSGKCGDTATWNYDKTTRTLTISGTGAIWDCDSASTNWEQPWVYWVEELETVVVESGITAISRDAFKNCTALKTVVLPDGLEAIGHSAFYGCAALNSISMPASVTKLENLAFYGCSGFTSIGPVGSGADYEYAWKDKIPANAFAELTGVTSATLVPTVTELGYRAFAYNESLPTIVLPAGLTTISELAFNSCDDLESITIPASVTEIGPFAFQFITGTITFEGAPPALDVYAFANSTLTAQYRGADCRWADVITDDYTAMSITWVAVDGKTPQHTEVVEAGKAATCTEDGLTEGKYCSVCDKVFQTQEVIPSPGHTEVTDAAKEATCFAPGLTEGKHCSACGEVLIAQEEIPMANHVFVDSHCQWCDILGGSCGETAFWSLDETTGKLTVFGQGQMQNYSAEVGADRPWYSYRTKVKSVEIRTGITAVGDYAFYGLTNLTEVSLAEGIVSLGNSAFRNCIRLTNVVLPEGIERVDDQTFHSCSRLASVTLPDSIQHIGAAAFYNCGSLTSARIPSGMTKVESDVFRECTALKTLIIPEGIQVIGFASFAGCAALEELNLPGTLTEIQDNAFERCPGIKRISIPEGVTEIGNYAFYGCSSATELKIPDTVAVIEGSAFRECTGLTSVVIPEGVVRIGYMLFGDCTGLTEVSLPGSISTVPGFAFGGCTGLSSITIPDSIQKIEDSAFYNCTGLKQIRFSGNAPTFGSDVFYAVTADAYYPAGDATWTEAKRDDYGGSLTWKILPCDQLGKEHTEGDAVQENVVEATCKVPGSYDSVVYCTVCLKELSREAQTTELADHEEVIDEAVDATCTESGLTQGSHCGACGEVLDPQEEIPANGHSAVADAEVEATCKDTGLTEGSHCGICSEVLVPQEKIPTVDHVYENGKCIWCSTSALVIVQQPVSVSVAEGERVEITIQVTGEGLTYQWYYKNATAAEFTLTTAVTGDTYFINAMTASRSGRQVYCVITDRYGNSVETDTVTIEMKATKLLITSHPVSITVAEGEKATVSFNAEGDGLVYEWYFKDAGASKFSKTTSFTSNKYSVVMTAARDGRQVYCIVTDANGNTAQTNTATLSMKKTEEPVKITAQPKSVTVAEGEKATVTFTASGEGLVYEWYFKDAGASKFSKTTSFTSNKYSVAMTGARDGRQVYCIVTDANGNTAKTDTVTLSMKKAAVPVKITAQPKSVTVAEGEKATVTFTAEGEALIYAWYFKDAGATKFSKTTSFVSNKYSVAMTEARDGRQVYCVVTDANGNTAQTDTVTLSMKKTVTLAITSQPKSITVAEGAAAKVSVTASGEGLTYQWYLKNPGKTSFSKSSVTSASYSCKMSASIDGRQVYCVITDANGNTVKTDTVTLSMEKAGVTITSQPQSVAVAEGATAKVTVSAAGDGLTYTWYIKNPGKTSFSKSSVTSATYSCKMSATTDGRQVYCIITDAYGNTAKTNTVTFTMK